MSDDNDIEPGPTCPECGADLVPQVLASELGIRVAYECPEHGLTSVIDPFG